MDFLLTCRRCEHWEPIANYHDLRYHLRVVHGLRQLANSDLCLYATYPHADPDVLRYGPVETRPSAFVDARHSIPTNRGNLISYGDLSDADSGAVNERISEMVAQGIERGIASVMARKCSDSDRERKRPIQPPSVNQKLMPTRVIRNEAALGKRAASELVTTDAKKVRKSASEEGECSYKSVSDEEVKKCLSKSIQNDVNTTQSTNVDEEILKLEERAKALKDLDLPMVMDELIPNPVVEQMIVENKDSSESSSNHTVDEKAPTSEKMLVTEDAKNPESVDDASKPSVSAFELPISEELLVASEITDKVIPQSISTTENSNFSADSETIEEIQTVPNENVQMVGSTSGGSVNKKKKQKAKDQKEQNTADANETDSVSTPKTRSGHRRACK